MNFFASDNASTVHDYVLEALANVNTGHQIAYGNDPVTESVTATILELTGGEDAYFTLNGTGTNLLIVDALTQPWDAVVLSQESHILTHESGGASRTLLPSPHEHGKVKPADLAQWLNYQTSYHQPRPRLISLAQCTELGFSYTLQEVRDIVAFAHEHDMLVHMDGARISNACAALGVSLREATFDLGIDALSFGMVKNGLMFGEVAVFARKMPEFEYLRKHHLQLQSKCRYIAAQYQAILQDDRWLKSAQHANGLCARMHTALAAIPAVTLVEYGGANMLFCQFPKKHVAALQAVANFYVEDVEANVARLVFSHDNTEADVDTFVAKVKELVG